MSQSVPISMVGLECPTCALAFAVPRSLLDIAVAEQRTLSCPQGHAVQLGRPARLDAYIHGLEANLGTAYGRLEAYARETAALRRTIVDVLVGKETAHD